MHVPDAIRHHKLATALTFIIAAPLLVAVLWTETTLHYTYSSGERAGFLQKISRRGWLCKTWEGQIQLTALPGAAPEVFDFTTRSDSIATLLNKYNGQKVVLDYRQHVGIPTSCFGDTEYYVVGVRPVGA